MAATAAHLVDHVIPRVPVRQWVLSLPMGIRYLIAYDSKLQTAVLGVFVRAVRTWYRRRAKQQHGVSGTETGAVTAIQRFGGNLNLNVHFHTNFADGVWTDEPSPRFVRVAPPNRADIDKLVRAMKRRIVRMLTRRGLLDDEGYVVDDSLGQEEPLLASAARASIHQRDVNGQRLGRVGKQRLASPGSRCTQASRFTGTTANDSSMCCGMRFARPLSTSV